MYWKNWGGVIDKKKAVVAKNATAAFCLGYPMLFSLELHLFPCLVGEDDVHALQVVGNAEGLDGGELLLGEGFVSLFP